MSAPATSLTTPLARYAQRVHAAVEGGAHHVASPLGAWLLLALCGPASTGSDRRELADALGCDAGEAAAVTARLLGQPHPLVAAAAALWQCAGALTGELAQWRAGLPPAVESGRCSRAESSPRTSNAQPPPLAVPIPLAGPVGAARRRHGRG
jgi:hypothetical protein